MAKVTGIGGVFFKAQDPVRLREWYRDYLGFDISESGCTVFSWRDDDLERPCTVWAPFSEDTKYFGPGHSPYMINLRVDDLDALLKQLRRDGVEVDERIEDSQLGRFGWITDIEGNRVELWEPRGE